MRCYFDNQLCDCSEECDTCPRDPFRGGDSAEDIRHLEVINGFRIEDEAPAVHE